MSLELLIGLGVDEKSLEGISEETLKEIGTKVSLALKTKEKETKESALDEYIDKSAKNNKLKALAQGTKAEVIKRRKFENENRLLKDKLKKAASTFIKEIEKM